MSAHTRSARREHPVVVKTRERRAADAQLRVADAIFLSTFVMIGQNRAAAFQQADADHDFVEQELELKTNTDLTREIQVLTTELHRRAFGS